MRYVIIGNSAAGVRGAETLRFLDHEAKITIITDESTPAYSRCRLQDYRPEQNKYKKIVLRDNVLVGMILVGDIRQAGIYGALKGSFVPRWE